MEHTFLPLIFRMKHIKRWSLMRCTDSEDLAQHTIQCAFIVHYLAAIGNKHFGKSWDANKLATHALFHDITEVLTGDLPTPVKYFNTEMRETYKRIEQVAAEKLTAHVPEDLRESYAEYINGSGLTPNEQLLLKRADKLCAYIKCAQEINAGNNEFRHAYDTIRKQIDKIRCNEIQYFIKHCMDGFSMSLDELKGML